MARIAVVGFGYWGPNLCRNFNETPGAVLAAICDLSPKNREVAQSRYPHARVTDSFDSLLEDPTIDAIVIATPVSTHAPLALKALAAGKHVLVEKPLAGSVKEAQDVVEAAEKSGKVLLVDHTFCYMGAVQKVKELIDTGVLGELYYLDSVRVNLGLIQHDVSVIWDLAVHDLSIFGFWVPQDPLRVSCTGCGHIEGLPEDVAYMTLFYPNNLIAHIHVNWLSPVKLRTTLVGGSQKMVVFDDLDPVEKIKVYDRGVVKREEMTGPNQIPLAYRRTGDIWMPQFDMTEALKAEAAHFVRCIEQGEQPLTGGRAALRIVRILEAAERSMKAQGASVDF